MFYWSGKAKALACFEVCYSTLGMPVVLCPEAENIQLIHLTRYRTLRKISVVIESLSVCMCVLPDIRQIRPLKAPVQSVDTG